MDGISKELNEQVELECEIRRLKLLADKLEAINRPKTRRAIEELKEIVKLCLFLIPHVYSLFV